MNSKQSKLQVTLNQWNEIIRKEIAFSADLRNEGKIIEATKMKLKIEKMMIEAA